MPKKISSKKKSSDKDKRFNRRVPINLLVDYKSNGHYLFDFCSDVSTGGVYIKTPSPLPTGSTVQLTFTIPDSKETIKATGKVIWSQSKSTSASQCGMGVQFDLIENKDRSLLLDFVKRYEQENTDSQVKETKNAS